MIPTKPSLDIFIPEDRRQALARGETLPATSRGAVLFADLFGFTKLTATLSSELGPQRGAEELTRQLDPIYTRLFDAIHDYRGSVINISGDGITCWFDGDAGLRAASCALQMQGTLAENGSIRLHSGGYIALGIKIAVSSGEVRRYLVGDPQIQLVEALAGRELDRVYAAQERLDKGAVAVSQEVLETIRDRVQVETWIQTAGGDSFAVIHGQPDPASRDPWPEIPPLDAVVARRWIIASIYERIRDEELDFLTELRQVVPMFLKFDGIDYDGDERAGDKLERFVRCVQAVLHRYEGFLCQLTIGDKGSYLYIVFGAPFAQEDSVNRSLAAALKLKEEIESLGFIRSIKMGLSHGHVWAGAHGGRGARTYSAIGAEVNIASRLMGLAQPGQVIVSPHIVEMAQNYSFQELPPIPLKGIEKPMSPSLLLGKSRTQGEAAEGRLLLGRQRERETLTQALQSLIHSSEPTPSEVVLIEGEAGIGKSHLASDFISQVKDSGVSVLVSETDPVEKNTQYFALRVILETIFRLTDTDDFQTSQDKILQAVGGDSYLAERAPLIGEVLPLRWPDNELTRQISGEARANSLRGVLLAILHNFTKLEGRRAPAALLFDDAQWLDTATWTLLNSLAREQTDLLIIVCLRPLATGEMGEQNEQELERLKSLPNTHLIRLSSLSGEDITALVSQRLGADSLTPPLLEFIRVRAQGNPFFSEELALALRDAGVLRVTERREALVNVPAGELSHLDFPDTVQGVVTSRIDRLAPSYQLTLKVASVIGRAFLLSLLANVHPGHIGSPTLEEYLSTLTRLGITELESLTPELAYMFKHVITQEVVYSLLTFAQRKQLHCAIAEWYEANHADDLAPYYSRLAYHWLRGEDHDKAIFYLDKAAQHALDLFANEEVVRYVNTLLELDQRQPSPRPEENLQHARWERMLGTAHFRLGRLLEAQAHLTRTSELLGRPIPDSPAKLSRALVGELFKQASHRFFPRQLLRQPERTQRAVEEELARVDIERVFYYSQNNALIAWGILRCLNLAERVGMPEQIAQGYSNLHMITGIAGLTRIDRAYNRLTDAALEKSDNASVRIYALLCKGVAHFFNCHWSEATRDFETGQQLADEIGDTRQWDEINGAFATSLYLQGAFDESQARWQEHLRRTGPDGTPQPRAWSLFGKGHILLLRGRVEEAIPLFQESLAVPMKNADDKILNASRYGALSLALVRHGDFDQAVETLQTQQRLSPAAPAISSTMAEYDSAFDAALELWHKIQSGEYRPSLEQKAILDQALQRIPRAVKVLKATPVNKAKASLYAGLSHELSGNHAAALRDWKKCIEFAKQHRQLYEQARAQYEIGRSLSAQDGSTRGELLSQACEIFERLNTPFELGLARAALESS